MLLRLNDDILYILFYNNTNLKNINRITKYLHISKYIYNLLIDKYNILCNNYLIILPLNTWILQVKTTLILQSITRKLLYINNITLNNFNITLNNFNNINTNTFYKFNKSMSIVLPIYSHWLYIIINMYHMWDDIEKQFILDHYLNSININQLSLYLNIISNFH